MNKGQTRGMVAIVIGFVIAIVAGIILSFLTGDTLSPTQTIMAAIVVFLIVSPLFGYGIFTYARSTETEAYATNEEMEKPRLLLDILREKGHGDIQELAAKLETDSETIKSYIDDLSKLELFSGIVDSKNNVIALVSPMVIEAIDQCKTCQNPITISGNVTICEHCGTEYHKP